MRYHYITVIRIFAMLSVIALHTVLPPVTYFSDLYTPFQLKFSVFLLNLLRIYVVPLFFMISGALMLNLEKDLPIDRLLKKVVKIGVVLVFIGTVFALIEIAVSKRALNFSDIFRAFFYMLADKSWAHLWYLYILIGLYLITPILRSAINGGGYLLIILFIFNICLPFISELLNIVLSSYGWNGIAFSIPFSGSAIFYYVLGYNLHSGKINISNKFAFVVILILVMYVFFACFSFNLIRNTSEILFWDINSLSGVLFSTCIYSLIKNNVKKKTDSSIIKFLSDSSFSIYIFHVVFTNFAYQFLKLNPQKINLIFMWGIVFSFTFFASLILTYILRKIPLLRRFL